MADADARPGWDVLLIAGVSGKGKSTVARTIARRCDADWLQVDDLRLALQWSDASLPDAADTAALRFFVDTADVWTLPADLLCEAMIAVGVAMTPAVAIVTGNHIAQRDRVVIEGDGTVPAVLCHPEVRPGVEAGRVRMVLLDAPADAESEGALIAAMVAWGVPVVPAWPWASLANRVLTSVELLAYDGARQEGDTHDPRNDPARR